MKMENGKWKMKNEGTPANARGGIFNFQFSIFNSAPRGRGAERGAALILALWTIGILSLLAFGLAFDSHLQAQVSIMSRRRAKAEALAQSGVVVAQMLLQKQSRVTGNEGEDAIGRDKWYEPAFRLSRGMEVRGLRYPLGEGEIILDIAPEPARRNVNRLTDEDWERVLDVGGIPMEMWEELIDSFKYWVGPQNAIPSGKAAGREFYESLEEPYSPRFGPVDSVQELLLVNGFTKAVLYGGVLNPEDPPDTHIRVSGIANLLTTYGDGRVNVNAADMRVLMTLPGIDEIYAGAIIEERQQRAGGTLSRGAGQSDIMGIIENIRDSVFRSEADFFGRIPGLEVDRLRGLITTSSGHFRVTAVGRVGNTARRVWAILQTTQGDSYVLRWREEI